MSQELAENDDSNQDTFASKAKKNQEDSILSRFS